MTTRKFGSSATRYTFTLSVDYTELDRILGCIPISKTLKITPPKNVTKIETILGNGNNIGSCTYSFLDPSKKSKRWVLTMKDAIKNVVLPPTLPSNVKCWWCHDLFAQNPLGCPMKLVQTKTKSEIYYSHANKKDIEVSRIPPICEDSNDDYYLTKGYFCCWECLLAYGESVKTTIEFRECIQYIYQMFSRCGFEGTIVPAPHYTLRQEYGGPLTDAEYRAKHERYTPTGNSYIRMVPIGELHEVTSKF